MRVLVWIFRLFLFLLLFGFAVKNDDGVVLRFFFGTAWQVPLVIVILVTFAAGALIGATAAAATLARQRRELGRLRRDVADCASRGGTATARPPLADGPDLPDTY
ncbi:MAG: LapA family protein [Zoogloea sp.]|nr:LapA family protein [Zoogloea sp.]